MDCLLPEHWRVVRHILCDDGDFASVASLAMTCRTARLAWFEFQRLRPRRPQRYTNRRTAFLQLCYEFGYYRLLEWARQYFKGYYVTFRCRCDNESGSWCDGCPVSLPDGSDEDI